MNGSEVCATHGKGGRPIKHARNSKSIPKGMMDAYLENLRHPQMLALDSEIALLDARMAHVLETIDVRTSHASWKEANHLFEDAQRYQRANKLERAQECVNNLHKVLRDGLREREAWEEVYDLWERRRRLVDSEKKRRMALQQIVTEREVMTMITRFIDIIEANVEDPHIKRRIFMEIYRMANFPGPPEMSVGVSQMTGINMDEEDASVIDAEGGVILPAVTIEDES